MGRLVNQNLDRSVDSAATTTQNRLRMIANRIGELQASLRMPTMTPDQRANRIAELIAELRASLCMPTMTPDRDNRIDELQASLRAGAPTITPDTPTPTPDQIANQIASTELQASLGLAPTTTPDQIVNQAAEAPTTTPSPTTTPPDQTANRIAELQAIAQPAPTAYWLCVSGGCPSKWKLAPAA